MLSGYYHDGKTKVDGRRCAPELSEGRFSIHSDIWAYGLLVWEIFSRGLQPFQRTHEFDGVDKRKYRENNRPILVDHSGNNPCLRPVQTHSILVVESMSDRDESDIQRL